MQYFKILSFGLLLVMLGNISFAQNGDNGVLCEPKIRKTITAKELALDSMEMKRFIIFTCPNHLDEWCHEYTYCAYCHSALFPIDLWTYRKMLMAELDSIIPIKEFLRSRDCLDEAQ